MDAPQPDAAPACRSRALRGSPWVRVGGVTAVLAAGVVSGLPAGVTADAAPVGNAERAEHRATVQRALAAPALPRAAEHRASVERAESAAAAERSGAAEAAAAPKRAAWAEDLEVIAHRGGMVWGPESTLASFRHAIEVGSDAIEVDVRFTRDGVPVILHDDTLDRTTNCSGSVARVTLRQLKKCDAGSWYRPNPHPGERVPTLDEALALVRKSSVEVYLHVKGASAAQARRIVDTVRENDMDRGRTTYLSDWHTVLSALRAAGAQRLGYVFHEPAGFSARYEVLVPGDFGVRRSDVAQAQRRGAYVVAVEGAHVRPAELDDLGLDGFIANDVDAVLKRVQHLESPQTRPEKKAENPDKGADGRDGGDGGEPGRRGGDDWDPNSDWDDDDWDPTDPDGPWARGY